MSAVWQALAGYALGIVFSVVLLLPWLYSRFEGIKPWWRRG